MGDRGAISHPAGSKGKGIRGQHEATRVGKGKWGNR